MRSPQPSAEDRENPSAPGSVPRTWDPSGFTPPMMVSVRSLAPKPTSFLPPHAPSMEPGPHLQFVTAGLMMLFTQLQGGDDGQGLCRKGPGPMPDIAGTQ